ncbi:hypothetical protein SDJN02_12058, partial [Cucurbita argyrosperma subsp. argyrosperma]
MKYFYNLSLARLCSSQNLCNSFTQTLKSDLVAPNKEEATEEEEMGQGYQVQASSILSDWLRINGLLA